jgi:hypothetical protein
MRPYFFIACILFLFSACAKEEVQLPVPEAPATVLTLKFPCGPACDALTWGIETNDGQVFEAIDLPEDYRESGLPVEVKYVRTGQKAPLYQGSGEEIIRIITIRKR